MCLYINSTTEARATGVHPYNKPYNDSDIRFKILFLNPQQRLCSVMKGFKWKKYKWNTSSRLQQDPIRNIATDAPDKKVFAGFHFYVHARSVYQAANNGYLAVAFKVKNFIAAGTNNGESQGEVWHKAKPIGLVKKVKGKLQIVPFTKNGR